MARRRIRRKPARGKKDGFGLIRAMRGGSDRFAPLRDIAFVSGGRAGRVKRGGRRHGTVGPASPIDRCAHGLFV